MKTVKWTAILVVGLLVAAAGCTTARAPVAPPVATPPVASDGDKPALTTKEQMASYAIGVEMAAQYKRLGLEVDPELVHRGIKDVQSGGKRLMTDKEVADAMTEYRSNMLSRTGYERAIIALENKRKGAEFLAENKTREGVVTLPSGLQFGVIKAGVGKLPDPDATVEVHYRGTLIDGTTFENTYEIGHPMTIQLSDPKIIAGLREALRLMPVGARWKVFIPSNLAFMDRGAGRIIGPNATLIYDLELIAIK